MVIEAAVIIGFAGIALLGMFIIKHKLMFCFPVFAIMISALIWIQFLILYLLGMPLNIICSSKDVIKTDTYSIMDMTIKPSSFIDDCTGGKTVFNARVNANGDSALAFIRSMVTQMLDLDNLVSDSMIEGFVTIPNPSTQFNGVNAVNLDDLNTTALDLATSYVFNLTSLKNQLSSSVNGLTPATFDADFGNPTTRNTKLSEFNTYATSINGAFTPFTVSYVESHYIVGGNNFAVSHT
jgi:hypothetical protein